jgi:hypothetical protein
MVDRIGACPDIVFPFAVGHVVTDAEQLLVAVFCQGSPINMFRVILAPRIIV